LACFLVPMAVAIMTTLFRKRFPEELRVNVLNLMLWGGVLGLALEHVAHGEVVPYPPFLTAGVEEVLPEMLTVGVPMTTVVSGVWVMALASQRIRAEVSRISRLGAVDVSRSKRNS